MNSLAIRVAVCGATQREARALRRAASGPDSRVLGAFAGLDDLEPLLASGAVEVVVLPDRSQPGLAARALKDRHPLVKVVAVAQPDDGDAVDAWATELADLEPAILRSFLF